jgi:hypothetical protein
MDCIGHPYYVGTSSYTLSVSILIPRRTGRSPPATRCLPIRSVQAVPRRRYAVGHPPRHWERSARRGGLRRCFLPAEGDAPVAAGYARLECAEYAQSPCSSWSLSIRSRDHISRREDQRKQQQTTKWYVHTYIHADDTAVITLGEAVVDGPHFSGKRHYGYGEVE